MQIIKHNRERASGRDLVVFLSRSSLLPRFSRSRSDGGAGVKILMNRAFDGQHLITTPRTRASARPAGASLIKRVHGVQDRTKLITFLEFFDVRSSSSSSGRFVTWTGGCR